MMAMSRMTPAAALIQIAFAVVEIFGSRITKRKMTAPAMKTSSSSDPMIKDRAANSLRCLPPLQCPLLRPCR